MRLTPAHFEKWKWNIYMFQFVYMIVDTTVVAKFRDKTGDVPRDTEDGTMEYGVIAFSHI